MESARAGAENRQKGATETGDETVAGHEHAQIVVDSCSRSSDSKICKWWNLLPGANLKRFRLILGYRSVYFGLLILNKPGNPLQSGV